MMKKVSRCESYRLIAKQALENLCEAITQHKWRHAKEIFPTIIPFIECNLTCDFIWKTLHLIMINNRIPLSIQTDILFILFKSPLNNHEIAVDWLVHSLEDIPEEKVVEVQKACFESLNFKIGQVFLRAMYRAYHALFFYVKWKKFYYQLEDPEKLVNERKTSLASLKEECLKEGQRIYYLLKSAITTVRSSIKKYDPYKKFSEGDVRKKTETDNTFTVAFEWLINPLLDLENYLCNNKDLDLSSKRCKMKISGFDVIKKYAEDHQSHLPAQRFYHNYVLNHHPEERRLILRILENIITLSPDSTLVIDYIEALDVKGCIRQGQADNLSLSSQSEVDLCLLSEIDQNLVMKCLSMLRECIEYNQSWKNFKAWKMFTDVLQILHSSWVKCWNCVNCQQTLSRLEEFAKTLALWPKLFFCPEWINNITAAEAEIIVHIAYTSFVIGYDTSLMNYCLDRLKHLDCIRECELLVRMTKKSGNHSRDLLVHLAKLRKGSVLKDVCFTLATQGEQRDSSPLEGPIQEERDKYKIKAVKNTIQYENSDKLLYIGKLVNSTSSRGGVSSKGERIGELKSLKRRRFDDTSSESDSSSDSDMSYIYNSATLTSSLNTIHNKKKRTIDAANGSVEIENTAVNEPKPPKARKYSPSCTSNQTRPSGGAVRIEEMETLSENERESAGTDLSTIFCGNNVTFGRGASTSKPVFGKPNSSNRNIRLFSSSIQAQMSFGDDDS